MREDMYSVEDGSFIIQKELNDLIENIQVYSKPNIRSRLIEIRELCDRI